ncbi:hypothetical protein MI170_06395 [Mycolicibacterium goodii]|uniref:hypothetical protein n=1 Tax=Mycolicibacterium goodii TaxID=134601 RepID=UPI001C20DB7B|nr:hypothetical protein [Mycolicibacterium goodii]ULN48995.1 hypothetical protein MI170_06395 [Mycolicibacterium goodii]
MAARVITNEFFEKLRYCVGADVTEPIPSVADSTPGRVELIRSQLTPSRIIAGISTTVAVVAVAALITVTTEQADTAPVEDKVAASPSTPAPAAPTTPAPAQPIAAHSLAPEVLLPASPSAAPTPAAAPPAADFNGGLGDIFTTPARSAAPPRRPAAPRPAPAASGANPTWPAVDLGQINSQWQSAVAVANAQPAVNAVVGTVTGTTGWVGNGAMNILGELLVAWVNQNGQIPGQNPAVPPADGLAALLLGPTAAAGAGLPTVDWSMVPPPQLPPIDWTKVPPPQLPPIDWTKVPPPQLPPIDWTKIPPPQLPHFDDPFARLPSITRAIGLPF